MRFEEKLAISSRSSNSLLCIGLDPDPQLMPDVDIVQFNREIIDATSDLVCAYKPNLAFYEAQGADGLKAMEKSIACIPERIPIIGDAKRADIASSSESYARALFDTFGFDAATVNPYLGYDAIEPFIDYSDKGVFILCRTSNPGASDFQDLLISDTKSKEKACPLFEFVAHKANEWNINGNVGLVVGATYPKQLKRIRDLYPDMALLIPGIGKQGGDLAETVKYGVDIRHEKTIINCSRQIIYADNNRNFAQAARREALKIRDLINSHLRVN